jgi:hypothetical protein
MTPSEYLETNPTAEEHSYNYLLIPAELRDSMIAKQDTLTTHNHISPVLLIDGRYGACCDLYTEVGVGGIYHQIWEMLDKAKLEECEVVDKAAFLALLPQPEPEIEV